MKKYYGITILALIVVTLLQGYNISLQNKDYVHNKTDRINTILKIATGEEYAVRAHKGFDHQRNGKQRVTCKSVWIRYTKLCA